MLFACYIWCQADGIGCTYVAAFLLQVHLPALSCSSVIVCYCMCLTHQYIMAVFPTGMIQCFCTYFCTNTSTNTLLFTRVLVVYFLLVLPSLPLCLLLCLCLFYIDSGMKGISDHFTDIHLRRLVLLIFFVPQLPLLPGAKLLCTTAFYSCSCTVF